MINLDGPEIGEADIVLKLALDLHFKGKSMALHIERKDFKITREDSDQNNVKKNSLPFYKEIFKKKKNILVCLWKEFQDIRKHFKKH